MLHYLPTYARLNKHQQPQNAQQRQQQQDEQYSVLAMDSKKGNNNKDVLISLRTPQTEHSNLLKIYLEPSGQSLSSASGSRPAGRVFIEDKKGKREIQVSDKQTIDPATSNFVQIYALQTGEIKVNVMDVFYVIYDGAHVHVAATSSKLRGATQGLCGNFDGNQYNDFQSPRYCILEDPLQFAASYAILTQGSSSSQVAKLKEIAQRAQCFPDELTFGNVISDRDAGREDSNDNHKQSSSCTQHNVKYQVDESNNKICFSHSTYPSCKPGCNPSKTVQKKVKATCLGQSRTTMLWAEQINKGSKPKFDHKKANSEMTITVPVSCRRN